jgi:hypothetical protein
MRRHRTTGAGAAVTRPGFGGLEPLAPERKWRAILVATVLLVPAFWALLAGLVADATESPGGPNPAAAVAFGLALVPFVFLALAVLSEHPRAPGAVVKAMGLALLVGIPVSAVIGDAVTGVVAGLGAGGIVALRMDPVHGWRPRAWAVVVASAYTVFLVAFTGGLVLLPAPIFPFTALGIADHLSERRADRAAARAGHPGKAAAAGA